MENKKELRLLIIEMETKWIEMKHTAGLRNGIYTKWHSNGQMESIENYTNGKLEDKSVAWYPDGSVKYEEYYFNGELQKGAVYFDKNGKPTSKEQQYYDSFDNSDEALIKGFVAASKIFANKK